MNRWLGILCALVVGIAIGYAIGVKKPRPFHLITDPAGKKVLVNPYQGDLLVWSVRGSGAPVKPDWIFGDPCDETNTADGCHVTGPGGWYSYNCPDCTDPEIPVGSDVVVQGQGGPSGSAKATAPVPLNLGCKNNNALAVPADVTASLSVNGGVTWYGNSPVTTWSITDLTICTLQTIDQAHQTCAFKDGTAAGDYPYHATLIATGGACPAAPAAGTIHVKP